MKFKTIYSFGVFDEIKKGEKVYCLDKATRAVSIINDMTVETALNIDDSSRYEIWKEVKESEENDG